MDALNVGGIRVLAGGVQLGYARIRVLAVEGAPQSGAPLPGPLTAVGWTVQDVYAVIRHDRVAAAIWLSTAPTEQRVAPQPWHELAAVYDRNGQPADARWLRNQAAKRTTHAAPWTSKPVRWTYGGLVGYGYYPLRAAIWLVVALLLTWGLTATHQHAFGPSNPTAAARPTPATGSTAAAPPPASAGASTITGATPCQQLASNYPCFNPLIYALDSALPSATGGQASAWRVTTNTTLALALNTPKTLAWATTAQALDARKVLRDSHAAVVVVGVR